MKPILFTVCLALLTLSCDSNNSEEEQPCDGGTFTGTMILSSQQEVDDFAANCYSKIEGFLYIGELSAPHNDITDLSGLESITEINLGVLTIVGANLTSLYGLHNLAKVNGLRIHDCYSLTDLSGLQNLQTIGNMESNEHVTYEILSIINNPNLNDLDGLQNVTYLKNLNIQGCINLNSLNGLDNVLKIGVPESNENPGYNGRIYIGSITPADPMPTNIELQDICVLKNILENSSYDSQYIYIWIYPNNESYELINLTPEELINGECNFQ